MGEKASAVIRVAQCNVFFASSRGQNNGVLGEERRVGMDSEGSDLGNSSSLAEMVEEEKKYRRTEWYIRTRS